MKNDTAQPNVGGPADRKFPRVTLIRKALRLWAVLASVLQWANAGALAAGGGAIVNVVSQPFEGTIAVLAPAPLAGNQNFGGPFGFDFDVVGCGPIAVTQLGAFDDNQDGMRRTIRVYIYDRDTQTAVVGPVAFSPGDDGQLFGGHRFKPLVTPVMLPPGFRGSVVAENYGPEEMVWNGDRGWGNPEDIATLDTGGGLIRFVGSDRYTGAQGVYPGITNESVSPVGHHGGTFVFEAGTGPSIDVPPVTLSVAPGEDAAFRVTASGVEPLSYQWRVKGIDLPWTDIPLANEPELLLTQVTEANAGHYRIVVTDGNGDQQCAQARLVVEEPNTPKEPAFFRDDFEDDDATDGNPVRWWLFNGGTNVVVDGSYILTTSGDAQASPQEFYSIGDVSIRARMRAVREVPAAWSGFGVYGTSANSPSFVPFYGFIQNGIIEVGDWEGGGILGSTNIPIDIFAADVNVQLDLLGNTLSLTLWQEGETKPAQPQLTRTSSRTFGPKRIGFNMSGGMREIAVRHFEAIAIGDSLPHIVQQPQDQTVLPGDTALLNVTASGPGGLFGYQWWKDGTLLDGATNATLTLTNVEDSMAGLYSVVLTYEQTTLTSAPARLTVSPLFFTAQPESQTVNAGSNATFSVSVASTVPVNYQWQLNGNDLEGATDSALILSGVSPADDGDYSVVASNAHGALTSQVARLTVLARPVIVQAPLSQSVVEGGSVTFSVEITGNPPPFGYQWRQGFTLLDTIPSSERLAFYTLENVQAAQAGSYRVVITNAASPTIGGGSPNATWTLTVLPDTDQDGLPDAWETEHEASNPEDDLDADGLTNREEYEAGTDPNAATSVLKIDAVALPDGIGLEFMALSNRTYTVQYNNNLEAGNWTTLADVVARSTNRLERVLDPTTQPTRYYRLLTPRTESR